MSTEAADLKTKKQRSKRPRTEKKKTPTETAGTNAEEAAIAATAP